MKIEILLWLKAANFQLKILNEITLDRHEERVSKPQRHAALD